MPWIYYNSKQDLQLLTITQVLLIPSNVGQLTTSQSNQILIVKKICQVIVFLPLIKINFVVSFTQ